MGLQEAVPESQLLHHLGLVRNQHVLLGITVFKNSGDLKGSPLCLGEKPNPQRTTETCWVGPGRVPFSPLGTGCLDALRGL